MSIFQRPEKSLTVLTFFFGAEICHLKMVGKYKKWYQSFGNCLYMHFKLKFDPLGQKPVIWVGGFTEPPPLDLFRALNTLIQIGLMTFAGFQIQMIF